jgi:hypothetical protein
MYQSEKASRSNYQYAHLVTAHGVGSMFGVPTDWSYTVRLAPIAHLSSDAISRASATGECRKLQAPTPPGKEATTTEAYSVPQVAGMDLCRLWREFRDRVTVGDG